MKTRRPVLLVIFALAVAGAVALWLDRQPHSFSYGGAVYAPEEIFDDPLAAALARAATQGNLDQIDRLIQSGANPNYLGKFEYTPVMWAIQTGGLAGFERLLARGGRVDIPNHTAWSAMGLAAGIARDPKFLELALKHGGNPNVVEHFELQTPIFLAIQSRDLSRVLMLIQAGADLNARSRDGSTPLMHCVSTEQYHAAVLLLQHGADPKITNPHGIDFVKASSLLRPPPWWTAARWWRRKALSYATR